MIKIAQHNIQAYGSRGFSISLPKVFIADNKLRRGEKIEIYRDQIDGQDVLIIKTCKPRKTAA